GVADSSDTPAAASGTGDFRDSVRSEFEDQQAVAYRPVEIVDARGKKELSVRIDVPVEDMAQIGELVEIPSGAASQGPKRTSIWQAIHPRLLELVKQHTSTL